jgi:23S rRNA (cytosine1962-C5)-methyltransferase
MALPTVTLVKELGHSIRRGHPWIYDRAMGPRRVALAPGQLVEVHARSEASGRVEPVATGFADPGCPIAVRVLTTAIDTAIDGTWVRARAREAASLRMQDPALQGCSGFRVVHGEGDFMPGLVMDQYAGTAVLVTDGAGARAFWRPHVADIVAGCADAGLRIERVWGRQTGSRQEAGEEDGRLLLGTEPSPVIVIEEHGARFEVDVRLGQKTGFFLDQRDNRQRVARLAPGAEVLNLFGYTGGFSVLAALAGARRTTMVDAARPAAEAARRNLVLNQLSERDHEIVCEDAFAFLERQASAGRSWDLVICDPPSFAPNQRSRDKALRAYRRLNALALAVVGRERIFCSASCSSHVSASDLAGVLADAAAAAGRRLQLIEVAGAASDHPTLPAFPEGNYLAFLVARVL